MTATEAASMSAIPSHAALDAARAEGDRPADRCVARLGREVWTVNAALRNVHDNQQQLPESLPADLREFLLSEVAVPVWLNRTRVLNAQRWAEAHLFHVTAALFCASLPSAYAAERGAKVLMSTRRMSGDLDRRVNETARFVLDVLSPGSFDPDGSALQAIRKVRLMHAAVRMQLRRRDEFAGEVPINQEDLLGTLLSFSVIVVRSVRRMGVVVDARDAEDFYHLWRGVGAMLGLRDDLMPFRFAAAIAATDCIALRQFRPSPHGQALMADLLAGIKAHFDLPLLRETPPRLVRYLLGDHTADILGVPDAARFGDPLARAARIPGLGRWSDSAPFLYLASRLGRSLLDTVISAKLRGAQVTFPMPTQ
jgi:hypothetical protein